MCVCVCVCVYVPTALAVVSKSSFDLSCADELSESEIDSVYIYIWYLSLKDF